LRDRFINVLMRTQYGVLYVPPPNATWVSFFPQPDTDNMPLRASVLYPPLERGYNTFEHNYCAASPDYGGVDYGRRYLHTRETVHTERLCLDLVWPRLLSSTLYGRWYDGSRPPAVYLYTYFLPCDTCCPYINYWLQDKPDIPLIVGFQRLIYGQETRESANERRQWLCGLLAQNGGMVLRLSDRQHAIATINDTCSADSENYFAISMDFSSGKAAVIFDGIPRHYNGWVGLYNSAGELYSKVWEWTHGKEHGRIALNGYIRKGDTVRYYRENDYDSLAITSARWSGDCGFGWTRMNNIPSNYGNVDMQLTVERGYVKISLRSDHYDSFDGYDFVAVQQLQQITQKAHWNWAYVTSMTKVNSEERYYEFWYGGALVQGFRAKLIYRSAYGGAYWYYWNDFYDNATPLWIPDECMNLDPY